MVLTIYDVTVSKTLCIFKFFKIVQKNKGLEETSYILVITTIVSNEKWGLIVNKSMFADEQRYKKSTV